MLEAAGLVRLHASRVPAALALRGGGVLQTNRRIINSYIFTLLRVKAASWHYEHMVLHVGVLDCTVSVLRL